MIDARDHCTVAGAWDGRQAAANTASAGIATMISSATVNGRNPAAIHE